MLRYKIDVLKDLKKKGYNTNRIRKEKLFAEATLQKFRIGQIISADNLDRLCRILECQPGDVLEYLSDDEDK